MMSSQRLSTNVVNSGIVRAILLISRNGEERDSDFHDAWVKSFDQAHSPVVHVVKGGIRAL